MKLIRYSLLALAVSVGICLPTHAHQSPASCNSNRVNLSISRDKITVKQGDSLTYTITLSNVDLASDLACDIDTATVKIILPALDGTPTGQEIVITTTGNYPAGTAPTLIGTIPYTVNVNNGVVDLVAQASVEGTLHDAPVDHAASISKTIGTTVVYDTPSTGTPNLPGMPNTSVFLQ